MQANCGGLVFVWDGVAPFGEVPRRAIFNKITSKCLLNCWYFNLSLSIVSYGLCILACFWFVVSRTSFTKLLVTNVSQVVFNYVQGFP